MVKAPPANHPAPPVQAKKTVVPLRPIRLSNEDIKGYPEHPWVESNSHPGERARAGAISRLSEIRGQIHVRLTSPDVGERVVLYPYTLDNQSSYELAYVEVEVSINRPGSKQVVGASLKATSLPAGASRQGTLMFMHQGELSGLDSKYDVKLVFKKGTAIVNGKRVDVNGTD